MGNRSMLRTEERNTPRNQLYLLQKAGIATPKTFKSPKEIDRLAIVKVPEANSGRLNAPSSMLLHLKNMRKWHRNALNRA